MSDIFSQIIEKHKPPQHPPLPEALVMTLLEIYDRYRNHRFVPGDIITPRKGYLYSNAGLPHIVLEVDDDPESIRHGLNDGACNWGGRYDARVATWTNGEYTAYWIESWSFELYELPK